MGEKEFLPGNEAYPSVNFLIKIISFNGKKIYGCLKLSYSINALDQLISSTSLWSFLVIHWGFSCVVDRTIFKKLLGFPRFYWRYPSKIFNVVEIWLLFRNDLWLKGYILSDFQGWAKGFATDGGKQCWKESEELYIFELKKYFAGLMIIIAFKKYNANRKQNLIQIMIEMLHYRTIWKKWNNKSDIHYILCNYAEPTFILL